MTSMQFKTFVWPRNPETYREELQRTPLYQQTADGTVQFQGLGPLRRTITGAGAFTGPQAYPQFKALRALLDETTAGLLTHPVWPGGQVFFTELKLTQGAQPEYVAYEFTFQAADKGGGIPRALGAQDGLLAGTPERAV